MILCAGVCKKSSVRVEKQLAIIQSDLKDLWIWETTTLMFLWDPTRRYDMTRNGIKSEKYESTRKDRAKWRWVWIKCVVKNETREWIAIESHTTN